MRYMRTARSAHGMFQPQDPFVRYGMPLVHVYPRMGEEQGDQLWIVRSYCHLQTTKVWTVESWPVTMLTVGICPFFQSLPRLLQLAFQTTFVQSNRILLLIINWLGEFLSNPLEHHGNYTSWGILNVRVNFSERALAKERELQRSKKGGKQRSSIFYFRIKDDISGEG